MRRKKSEVSLFQKLSQMDNPYTADISSAFPIIEAHDIFGIIVLDCHKVAELAISCRFVRHQVAGLDIYHPVILSCDKINLPTRRILAGEDFIFILYQMKEYRVFHQFAD